MKSGFPVTTGDPRTAAELPTTAEAAGWDVVSGSDGIAIGDTDTSDPWVAMPAMATGIERIPARERAVAPQTASASGSANWLW